MDTTAKQHHIPTDSTAAPTVMVECDGRGECAQSRPIILWLGEMRCADWKISRIWVAGYVPANI